MYSGTLGRVNALEFRDVSPTKASQSTGQNSPRNGGSPLKSPFSAAVAPASPDAIKKAFAKVKEVAQSSASCSELTEADLMACLQLASSPPKPASMSTHSPTKEPESEQSIEQTLLLNALLSSLSKLNADKDPPPSPVAKTPPPSPVMSSAKQSPLKRTPSSLGRIQESLSEDMESPRSTADDSNYYEDDDPRGDMTILPIDEAKRCLRGGSMVSRIRVRRQPSLKDLEEKRVSEVVEKLNRPSIIQHTMPPRRLSVVDPKTRSLSRVNSIDELVPPMSRKPSLVTESRRGTLSRKASSVSFAPPPAPIEVDVKTRKKKKKFQQQARMSTLASHIKKLLNRSDKAKRSKARVLLDASTRVSNMRLGTSPKKCKVKHEDLTTYTRPNCRPRRWVPKTGDALLERKQSYVSLDVMDNIGTRAACPVHLLSERSTADFSYVPGVVNSFNRRRRRRSTRRPKLMKRPSLWIVD